MTHSKPKSDHSIHRFVLLPNTSKSVHHKITELFSIIVIPMFLGGFIMVSVFNLRDTYLIIAVSLMLCVLVNLYIFYQRRFYKSQILKLIIHNDLIQITDSYEVFFQDNIQQLSIQMLLSGKKLQPAVKLSGLDFQGIIISLKNLKIEHPITTKNKLCQPDYRLAKSQQANILFKLFERYI